MMLSPDEVIYLKAMLIEIRSANPFSRFIRKIDKALMILGKPLS